MSSILTIEGKEYTPATIAGRHLGYTKDYLLMLIKGGKIDGKKIGHKWFVYLPSAEEYFVVAKQEQEARRKKLSEERKAELRTFAEVLPASQSSTAKSVKTPRRKISFSPHAKVALLETLVIVFLGVSVGSLGYVGTVGATASVHQGGFGFFKGLAVTVYEFFTPAHEEEMRTIVAAKSAENPLVADDSGVIAHVGTTTHTSLVVGPDELFTATTIESVQDSFSDEVHVSVDPENQNTGVITPVFKDGEGEEYRFLMVPVNAATQ